MLLKLPETKKEIRLKEDGETYELDISNISAMRELVKLSGAALSALSGNAWSEEEERDILQASITAIGSALGEDAYSRMCGEIPALRDNALLLLSICGQLHEEAQSAVNAYIGQYKRDGLEEVKQMAEAVQQVQKMLDTMKKIKPTAQNASFPGRR